VHSVHVSMTTKCGSGLNSSKPRKVYTVYVNTCAECKARGLLHHMVIQLYVYARGREWMLLIREDRACGCALDTLAVS
jgi:hypothetical protein